LSRFCTAITEKNVYEKLLKELNKQLEKHKIIVKKGAIVEASVIDTSIKPKGKPTYEVVEDLAEELPNEGVKS
jgi:IS5 family transposase